MMEAEGIGTLEAVMRLETLRTKIGAEEIVAHFDTKSGDVDIVVDKDGFSMYVDGRPVPRVGRQP